MTSGGGVALILYHGRARANGIAGDLSSTHLDLPLCWPLRHLFGREHTRTASPDNVRSARQITRANLSGTGSRPGCASISILFCFVQGQTSTPHGGPCVLGTLLGTQRCAVTAVKTETERAVPHVRVSSGSGFVRTHVAPLSQRQHIPAAGPHLTHPHSSQPPELHCCPWRGLDKKNGPRPQPTHRRLDHQQRRSWASRTTKRPLQLCFSPCLHYLASYTGI